MNTNNKEAVILLQKALKYSYQLEVLKCEQAIENAIGLLLQDNEDTEVEHQHVTAYSMSLCEVCRKAQKPSSKVEKLKELQRRFSTNLDYGAQWADLIKLTEILIEDEE